LDWKGTGEVPNGEIVERETPRAKSTFQSIGSLEHWSGDNPRSKIHSGRLQILERVGGDALRKPNKRDSLLLNEFSFILFFSTHPYISSLLRVVEGVGKEGRLELSSIATSARSRFAARR
jgi:hypothetical protein